MTRNYFLTFWLLLLTSSILGQELALVRERNSSLFGYINSLGEMVIEPQFKEGGGFSNGLAAVLKDKLWGYINEAGEWEIEPKFDKARQFYSGIALVKNTDGKWQYIKKSGKILEVPVMEKYFNFHEGVAIYKKSGKVGLLGTDGKLVLGPIYDEIKTARNGHSKVLKGQLWGMINTNGEVVVPIEYTKLGYKYHPSGVSAEKNGIFGLVRDGTFYPVYGAEKVWSFHGDATLTYARRDNKIGFVNNKGEWIIEPIFNKAKAFSKGLAPVFNGKKWGFIDEQGKLVIEYQFKDAEIFADIGLAPVQGRKWGFMNTVGKLVIPMKYDVTFRIAFIKLSKKGFASSLVRVQSNSGWGFLNQNGELLGNTWYQEVRPFQKVNGVF